MGEVKLLESVETDLRLYIQKKISKFQNKLRTEFQGNEEQITSYIVEALEDWHEDRVKFTSPKGNVTIDTYIVDLTKDFEHKTGADILFIQRKRWSDKRQESKIVTFQAKVSRNPHTIENNRLLLNPKNTKPFGDLMQELGLMAKSTSDNYLGIYSADGFYVVKGELIPREISEPWEIENLDTFENFYIDFTMCRIGDKTLPKWEDPIYTGILAELKPKILVIQSLSLVTANKIKEVKESGKL